MKIEHHSRAELGPALAARVGANLRQAIVTSGRASIAVPGGSTPGTFLAALQKEDIDWRAVAITLTDERCVPFDSPRSNHQMVAQSLLQGTASMATFVPLFSPDFSIEDVSRRLIDTILPLDVCVLGMGDDMHTASLFPGMPGLVELLDRDTEQYLSRAEPPCAEEARVTLTARALSSAANTYLLIRGRAKYETLGRALATEDPLVAPVRAILDAANAPVVFYAD